MGLLTFVWVLQSVFKIIMLNYQASDDFHPPFLLARRNVAPIPATLVPGLCPMKKYVAGRSIYKSLRLELVVLLRRAPVDHLIIRNARSSSVHFRNSGFALRQSEMFNPRTRSYDGNVRMGWKSTALRAFTQIPHVSGAALRNLGHWSWPKEASRQGESRSKRIPGRSLRD